MKKKHPEHVNLERWLVSYADFITLLFAFFVVMYAISQADMAKFKKVSQSLRTAFSSAGPAGMVDLGGSAGGNTANPFEPMEPPGGRALNMPAGKTHTATDPDPELQEMKELLEETITLELGVADTAEKIQMQFDSRGLIVRLAAKDFFEEGEVEIKPDLLPLLDRIGKIVSRTKKMVRVEGHTDIAEENAPGYPSPWELSSARAAWVLRRWVSRLDLNAHRFGVAGYAHYHPITTDENEWGRGKNRRIEIIILNNQYEFP